MQLKIKQDKKYLKKGEKNSQKRIKKGIKNRNQQVKANFYKPPVVEENHVDVMQYAMGGQTNINDQSLVDESIDCDRIDNEIDRQNYLAYNLNDNSFDRSMTQEEDYKTNY